MIVNRQQIVANLAVSWVFGPFRYPLVDIGHTRPGMEAVFVKGIAAVPAGPVDAVTARMHEHHRMRAAMEFHLAVQVVEVPLHTRIGPIGVDLVVG